IQYFDGFSGRVNAKFEPSLYGLDLYYPGDTSEGRVRRFDKLVHLYKLHGSIHWQHEKGGGLYARHQQLPMALGYRARSPSGKAELLQSDALDGVPEFGILPTSLK